jgi:glucosylceramidase
VAHQAGVARAVQWTANGGLNQQWSFTPTGDGFYKFSPVSQLGGSLDVPNGSNVAGTRIQQWTWTGTPWQLWSITPIY